MPSPPALTCSVCGSAAETFRYFTHACRACAAFFRRAIVLNQKFTCSQGGGCDIRAPARCACRACRFAACLAAGMSRERVFEAIQDMQYTRPKCRTKPVPCEAGTSGNVASNSNLVTCVYPQMRTLRNESAVEAMERRMPLLGKLSIGYSRLTEQRRAYTASGVPNKRHPYAMNLAHKLHVQELDYLNTFDFLLRYFPDIAGLNETLKQRIIKIAFPHLAAFNKSIITAQLFPHRFDVMAFLDGNFIDTKTVGQFMSSDVITAEEAKRIFKPYMDLHETILTTPMRRMQLSRVEEVSLSALIVANVVLNELPGYADDLVIDVQKEIFRELFEYYSSLTELDEDKSARVGKITSLLSPIERLVALQQENDEILRTYTIMFSAKSC